MMGSIGRDRLCALLGGLASTLTPPEGDDATGMSGLVVNPAVVRLLVLKSR
jgi:hypothetical protein